MDVIKAADPDLPIQLDLKERIQTAERELARLRIAELQRKAGSTVPVRIAIGSVKEALIGAAVESDADVLVNGSSPQPDRMAASAISHMLWCAIHRFRGKRFISSPPVRARINCVFPDASLVLASVQRSP